MHFDNHPHLVGQLGKLRPIVNRPAAVANRRAGCQPAPQRTIDKVEATAEATYHTSGFIRLTRPQLVGTLAGVLLSLLDQTIVGTA